MSEIMIVVLLMGACVLLALCGNYLDVICNEIKALNATVAAIAKAKGEA